GRVADGLDTFPEKNFQYRAAIVRRTADEEVVRRRAPILLQPLDVRFEAAGCRDKRAGTEGNPLALPRDGGRPECAILDVEIDHFGLVFNFHPQPFGGEIERVEHRASATEKKGV